MASRFRVNHKVLFSNLYKINILLIAALLMLVASLFVISTSSFAAGITLDTSIPTKDFNVPAGNLGKALATFSAQAGVVLVFDPILTDNKNSAGLQGKHGLVEGYSELLRGSGLEVTRDKNGDYSLKRSSKVVDDSKNLPDEISLKEIAVRSKRFYEIGPLPGLGLTKEQIPGNVQSISAQEIKDSHALSITELMNQKLQSVNVNDYQGNPFQMDVTYRGFTASPQIGTPQGLSVFLDGIRVNEPFGDVVNWDMIPMNALASLDVFPGSNPIFGLGTLGGAFSLKTKDGFNHKGVDAEVLTGSFGRKQLQMSGGWNNGTVGLFGAGNFFLEDGWRENSPSRVNQAFGKATYRGEKLDLNLSTLIVQNELVGNGLVPSEMYAKNPDGSFTSPDTTTNNLLQFQLSSSYFVSDTFTITGQVYRRNSKRHQVGADVYTEYGNALASRNMEAGDQYTCLYNSTNKYGLPDYYVLDTPSNIADIFNAVASNDTANPLYQEYLNNSQAKFLIDYFLTQTIDTTLLPSSAFNQDLPDYYSQYAQYQFNYNKNFRAADLYRPQAGGNGYNPPSRPSDVDNAGNIESEYLYANNRAITTPGITDPIDIQSGFQNYYLVNNGNGTYNKRMILSLAPQNQAACEAGQAKYPKNSSGGLADLGANGVAKQYDGAQFGGPGLVKGVPTAVITDTQIDQIVNGASGQLNWNFEHHKFMVGASIDSATAKYGSGQRLGFFDANRNAYLDPAQALDALAAADTEVRNNDFEGTSVTKSVYASETWSPTPKVNVTGAVRYNDAKVNNTLANRTYGSTVLDLHQFVAEPDQYNICRPGDPCITGYKIPDLANLLNPRENEKFSYYSLNPSLGATWQAKDNLNLYSNWAQGVRTPSVIELGCALDKTPVRNGGSDENPIYIFKSIAENRSCSLPSTLSGDPYLPQIKATTYDVGMRGTITSMLGATNLEWNMGAYRTNLKDDIYLVTFPGNRNFFDTIGKTRRQGLEMGVSGRYGKAQFKLNYSLTDATFQDTFDMASNDNSSAVDNLTLGGVEDGGTATRSITVKPGNRMPGVPLHNMNASFNYSITDKWSVGLTAVLHSESFVRGNENNQHQPGVTTFVTYNDPQLGTSVTLPRQPTNNPGTVPGYATFNFQTRYKFNDEWSLGLQVVNIFDREYFSAGRLGRNPFSPSINGAIGPDGYNHNSLDWLSTNFIAPGAPRAAWVSLRYEFAPDKK